MLKRVFLSLLLSAAATTSASAYNERPTHACDAHFMGVKKVLVSYEQATQATAPDWADILNATIKPASKLLGTIGIPVVVTQPVANTGSLASDELYLKVIFSSMEGEKFPIPFKGVIVATWTEVYRNVPGSDGKTNVPYITYSPKLTRVNSSIDGTNPEARREVGSIMKGTSSGILNEPACRILHYTAGKDCTNIADEAQNKIVPATDPCIR